MAAANKVFPVLTTTLLFAVLGTAVFPATADGASVPTGFQEYIVLGNDRHLWEMFNYTNSQEYGACNAYPAAPSCVQPALQGVVSVTASSNNQLVIYDHWEDGFETGLIDPASPNYLNPAQPSTMIFGNGNTADGAACDFLPGVVCAGGGPAADDVLLQGDTLTLSSLEGTAGGGCTATSVLTYVYPANLTGCVPVFPNRLPGQVRFDGGDWLGGSGGPLAIIRVADPETTVGYGSQGVSAGATEMISRQAVGNAVAYFIPVGEDIYLGNNTVTEPFKYVYLDLAAYEDGTSVSILSPGAGGGTVSFTLNRGQHYSSRGLIDNVIAPALALRITAGTKVSADKPVSGVIYSASDGTYATGLATLLPDILHATEYITTAGEDDNGILGNNASNIYIFNPDPTRAIDVTLTDAGGSTTVSVQPSAQTDFLTAVGREITANSTVRMTSDKNFWGVSIYGHQQAGYDWSYSWLANKFLTNIYTIPYAPDGPCDGTIGCNPGAAPVHISPTLDRTCVWVDFNNDGTFDAISNLAGGTTPPLATGPCSGGYLANNLAALTVSDPDADNTGTRIVTNKPVAIAYGQHTDRALASNTGVNYRDFGYVIYPVNQKFLDPVLLLDKTSDVTRVPLAGGPATYTIRVTANDYGLLTGLMITDTLPAGAAYVPDSTVITYPDLSQESGPSANPALAGPVLDWSAALDVTSLAAYEEISVTYTVNLPAGPSASLVNTGQAQAALGASIFSPSDTHQVTRTDVTMAKSADVASVAPGDTVTFTVAVANPGAAAETNVFVTDPIPADMTFVAGSIVNAGPFTGSYVAGQNAVVWTAVNLPTGAPVYNLVFQARVNPNAVAGTIITNTATFESDQTHPFDSTTPLTIIIGPDLAVTKAIVGTPTAVHPLELVTYEVSVTNSGAGPATDLVVSDVLPSNATYLPGSMSYRRNTDPYTLLTDVTGDDNGSLVGGTLQLTSRRDTYADLFETTAWNNQDGTDAWSTDWIENDAAGAGPGAGDIAIVADLGGQRLMVRDNGRSIERQANLSGFVEATLSLDYRRVGLDSTAEYVTVEASSNGGGAWFEIGRFPGLPGGVTDPSYTPLVFDLTPYLAVNTRIRLSTLGAGAMDDTDLVYVDNVQIRAFAAADSFDLPSGESVTLRFTVYPNLGTAGQNLGNQAEVASDQTASLPSDLVQVPIVGGTTVSGHVFFDYDGNGTQDPGEPDMPNMDVTVTDSGGVVFTAVTDANGDYTVVVPTGNTTFNVDETDPDFPPGGVLTTANDPQIVNVGVDSPGDVGYQPTIPLTIDKSSDAPAEGLAPGDTVTYTMVVTNYANANQTQIRVGDTLPTGVTYVAQSTVLVGSNTYRDEFNTTNYNNSNGTLDWSGSSWVETGSGADMDIVADLGVNYSLHIQDNGNSLHRDVDLSGTTAATLSFSYRRVSLDDADEFCTIEVSPNGAAGPWTELDRFANGSDAAYVPVSYNLPAGLRTANARIRFSTLNGVGMNNGDDCYFDDVELLTNYTRTNAVAPPTGLNNGVPPNLLIAADNVGIPKQRSLTVTFQATVDSPLDPLVLQLTNTATTFSNEDATVRSDVVTDSVVRPAVKVSPNGSGVVPTSALDQTLTFRHVVTNTSLITDTYDLSLTSVQGWKVELIDPATGAAIATDSNGDGIWDGGAEPNTGTLAPGASKEFGIRVTVPAGTGAGTSDSVRLTATSDRSALVTGIAEDVVRIIDAGVYTGEILLWPDNMGSVLSGGQVAYTHTLENRTGFTDSFALDATNLLAGWSSAFYRDSNGDGVYTVGVDTLIVNTKSLADRESQTFFLVVTAPVGASPGDTDVAFITAGSNGNPDLVAAASDTTIVPGSAAAFGFLLSGGGSHLVVPATTDIFPGTLENTGTAADRYELTITPSIYAAGQPSDDGLPHPTTLCMDFGGNGAIDVLLGECIATDTDGDGDWDSITAGYDTDGDGNPDYLLAAGAGVYYELHRLIDAGQGKMRDAVTLKSTAGNGAGETQAVTAVSVVLLATRAVVAEVRAWREPSGTIVSWTTLSEYGTIGFFIERRTESGTWERVNTRIVPAFIGSRAGGTYRLLDRGAPDDPLLGYLVVEVEARGRVNRYGPFDVSVEEAPPLEVLESRLTAAAPSAGPDAFERDPRRASKKEAGRTAVAATAEASANPVVEASGVRRRAKVRIGSSGLYRLSSVDIAAALGKRVRAVQSLIARNRIRVSNLGRAVAVRPLAHNRGLLFYGKAIDTTYSGENVYWVQVGRALRMRSVNGRVARPVAGPGSFRERSGSEESQMEITHLVLDPQADYWMWDYLYPDVLRDSLTVTVPSPGALPGGPAVLTVTLHGGSDTAAPLDHHALFFLNGTYVGETHWDGTGPWTYSENVVALLNDGDNELEIRGVRDPGVDYSVFYLNRVGLEYDRGLTAVDDRLELAGGGALRLAVDGFGSPRVMVFDVTAPRRPKRVNGVIVDEPFPGYYRASFRAASPNRRFLAVTPAAVQSATPVADRPSSLRTARGADYLVIAGGDLVAAAQELADHRASQGLRALVVDVEDVYDEFGHGLPGPHAIRAFLSHATSRWQVPPLYVLLAGEGSYDYRNYLGADDSIVPPLLTPTPEGLFPSDGLLADGADGDGLPGVAVGRIPARSGAELAAFIAKLKTYEIPDGAPWRRRGLFAADIPDEGGRYPVDAEVLLGLFPPGFEPTRVYLDTMTIAAGRAAVLAAVNAGTAYFTFVGHAGFNGLGNDDLFSSGALPGLTNGERLPVLAALTCLAGAFGFPDLDSFAEEIVLKPDGGAIAVLAPSGLAVNEHSVLLGDGFYRALFRDGAPTLGDAFLSALRRYVSIYGATHLVTIYNLIGDPATRLQ